MSDTSGSFDLASMLAEDVATRQSGAFQNYTAFPATQIGGRGAAAPAPAASTVPDDDVASNISV